MDKINKQAYIEEINYQKHQLNRLKKYLRNSMLVSSVAVCLIIYAQKRTGILVLGIILLVLSILISLVIGLAIRNGSRNLEKIIEIVEKQ